MKGSGPAVLGMVAGFFIQLAGCAGPPDEWERSLMQPVVLEACSSRPHSVLQEELATDRPASTEIYRVRDYSGLISEEMKRDYVDRNREMIGSPRWLRFPTVVEFCLGQSWTSSKLKASGFLTSKRNHNRV